MIAIVACFTVYFYISNGKQRRGKVVLEGVVSSSLLLPQVP